MIKKIIVSTSLVFSLLVGGLTAFAQTTTPVSPVAGNTATVTKKSVVKKVTAKTKKPATKTNAIKKTTKKPVKKTTTPVTPTTDQ